MKIEDEDYEYSFMNLFTVIGLVTFVYYLILAYGYLIDFVTEILNK